jgi:hypothetical protein
MSIVRQNARRFGAREINFPVGKTLYHGSLRKLLSGYPNKPDGNWFATDPKQSILHALQAAGASQTRTPYLYIYKVIRSPRLIKFTTPVNFNAYAKKLGFTLEAGTKTFAYSSQNYQVAKKLCQEGLYDGWWFPDDQTQVMLCNPMRFLKFVKVLEVKRPAKGVFTVQFINGEWMPSNTNKYSTAPARINNIININQPSPKAFYYVRNKNLGKYVFFDVNGNPVNINRSKNTFNYKGKTYSTWGTMGSFSNDPNYHKAKIMAARIKDRTGKNVNNRSILQFNPQSNNNVKRFKEKKEAQMKYWNLLNFKKPNVNLNASSLYKNV